MNPVLTLVSSDTNPPLSPAHIEKAQDTIRGLGGNVIDEPNWLSEAKACDILLSSASKHQLVQALQNEFAHDKIDVFVTRTSGRRKKLLLADMDSTIVTGETLDDLAEFAGLKDHIAAITARAMNGELDFEEALNERVGLLKGLGENALHKTLESIKLSKGAEIFVKTMAAHEATCVLVSGGFTFFTGKISKQAGFHHHHGNQLEISKGARTVQVVPPILDKNAKLRFLNEYAKKQELELSDTLTIGDGANDLPMLEAAGLGIGYQPKPAVRDKIHNCILHGDLTAALYAQGYKDSDFSL